MIKISTGRVRAGLAAKGMTAEETARQIGLARSTFDRILRDGQCTPIVMGRIARALDIPVWELVAQ